MVDGKLHIYKTPEILSGILADKILNLFEEAAKDITTKNPSLGRAF